MSVEDLFASPYRATTSMDSYMALPMAEWCQEHCDGELINYVNKDRVHWCFENENDAMIFALRWAD